jgi:hypothetical protein
MVSAICAAAGRQGQSLTWKEAEEMLVRSGFDDTTAHGAANLLARIETAKFSGAALDDRQGDELLGMVRDMVRKITS